MLSRELLSTSCPLCARGGADGEAPRVLVPLGAADGDGFHWCRACGCGFTLEHLAALADDAPRARDARRDLLNLARCLPLLEGARGPDVWNRERWSGGGGGRGPSSGRGELADAKSPQVAAAVETLAVLGALEDAGDAGARHAVVLWAAYVHSGPDTVAPGEGDEGWHERVAVILGTRVQRLGWLLEPARKLRAGHMRTFARELLEGSGAAYLAVELAEPRRALDHVAMRATVAAMALEAERDRAAIEGARRATARRDRAESARRRAEARAHRR